ncbi:MAG: PAS domain S-box protein [Thermoplasmata archaeon]|nr:MAG: PAS domain S-box protein [Thermoplasmata archaeon]
MQFIYGLLFSISSLAIIFAIFSIYRAPRSKWALSFIMVCIAIWSFGYAFELKSNGFAQKVFWAKFEYFGIAPIAVAWLIFVLQYVGKRKYITPRNILLLFFDPLITIILVWNNEFHHLIWKSIEMKHYTGFSILVFEYGGWAKIHTAYVYLLFSFSLFILLQIFSSHPYYKKQALALALSSTIPWIANLSYVLRFTYLDATPLAFLFTSIVFIYLMKYRFLDILPVAKESILESMDDAVIAVDRNMKILYLNPAALKLIGLPLDEVIGSNIELLESLHHDLARIHTSIRKEIEIKNRYFEIKTSPIIGECNDVIGYFAILRDVTERKMAEKKLEEALKLEKDIKIKMAHYFFNPIAIAKGFLLLNIEEGKNGKVKKALEAIERIEKIVKNIITKGRIEE